MNKKTMKIISILTIILCVVMSASTVCFADIAPGSITGEGALDAAAEQNISNIGNTVAGIIRNVGIVLAVIIVMVLGLKYMMGSAQEKAEYKKTMIPYIVGAVLLFGASAIATMVISFVPGSK